MKKHLKFLSLLSLMAIVTSCSNNDESQAILDNPKSVTDCRITIGTDDAVSICMDGTKDAIPNEIIKFASSFYSRNDNPADTQFNWTVESGNMEILKVENSTDGSNEGVNVGSWLCSSDGSGEGMCNVGIIVDSVVGSSEGSKVGSSVGSNEGS